MNHAMKASVGLGLFVVAGLATGCASADPDFEAAENVATSAEAVVSGWTSWSESSRYSNGLQVGCDNGSLVAGIRRQDSKTKIYCTPVAGANNTESYWTGWTAGGTSVAATCPSTHWVTGYQSSSWEAGSGFRVRCSKTPGLFTGFCPVPYQAGDSTGDTWFGNGYYMKGGGCGSTCALLKWTACIATPKVP